MGATQKTATREESDASLANLPPTELHHRVCQFLYREARLADAHDYDDWEALWEDDAIYWVPAGDPDADPEQRMSVIYDNRSRIGVRVAQLKTGRRHTQTPRSSLARVISNVELLRVEDTEADVAATMIVHEENLRGRTIWAARTAYRLRQTPGGLRLVRKKVVLVDADKPIFTLSFLI